MNKFSLLRAFKDIIHMMGLWFVMQVNPIGAGEIMERWGRVLQHKSNE